MSARWRAARGLDPLRVDVVEQAWVGSAVHERMRWYKDAADEAAGRELSMRIGRRLADWAEMNPTLHRHADVVTSVPSLRRAPMESVVDMVPALVGRHRRLVIATRRLRREHDPSAFVVESAVAGQRVLVVDDVFVSGATVLSAADALSAVGADVVGVLVMARLSRRTGHPRAASR